MLSVYDKNLIIVGSVISIILILTGILVFTFVPPLPAYCATELIDDPILKKCIPQCNIGWVWSDELQKCQDRCVAGQQWSTSLTKCIPVCEPSKLYNPITNNCEIAPTPTCNPPFPSVNVKTGEIINKDAFKTCALGSQEELDTLCKASVYMEGSARWDGYNPTTGECYKTPDCSTQICDVLYCQQPLLGQISKITSLNDSMLCENPLVDAVKTLCLSSDITRKWKMDTYCVDTTVNTSMEVLISLATTDEIKGTLSHSIVNIVDKPIQYTFTLQGEDGTKFTGTCNIDSTIIDNNGVKSFFTISLNQITLESGQYKFWINGQPYWDLNYNLYIMSPINVFVLPGVNDPLITKALNIYFSSELAMEVVSQNDWVVSTLTSLASNYKDMFIEPPPGETVNLAATADINNSGAVLVGCTAKYCTTSLGMTSKMVVLAWMGVTALQITNAELPLDSKFGYFLLRQYGTNEFVELVGETSQPIAVLVGNDLVLTFVDVVPIRMVAQYILACYVMNPDGSNTSYSTSLKKSQQTLVAVSIGEYLDAFCHAIIPPGNAGNLPPWMWRDPVTGMCTWLPDDTAARDSYCMFEYCNIGEECVFNPETMSLANANTEQCAPIKPNYPALIENYTTLSCDSISASNCISGTSDKASVSCSKTVNVGDNPQFTLDTFQARVQNAVNFYKAHGDGNISSADIERVDGGANQETLWQTAYNKCGPQTSSKTWGSPTFQCVSGDSACKSVQTMSGCDRNMCEPWTPLNTADAVTYTQSRHCYPSEKYDVAQSECCSNQGTYSLDTNKVLDRGMCSSCQSTYKGPTCNSNACENIQCDGHGMCELDANGNAKCICHNGYYNIIESRAINNLFDCKPVDKDNEPCQPYIINAEGEKVRNPDCDWGICTCTKMCKENELPVDNPDTHQPSCIARDPLRCVDNDKTTIYTQHPEWTIDPAGCAMLNGNYVCESPPSSTQNPYHYENPETNDFLCKSCITDGNACNDFDVNCCSRKHRTKCIHSFMSECTERINVCDG